MERLSPETLRAALQTEWCGREIHYLPTVDSTNEAARRLADAGSKEGAVVITDNQLRGKGRRGRRWFSRPGEGICFSLILRPPLPPAQIPGITLLAGVAVCRAIEDRTGLRPGLKWPNDLILAGKKLGGILAETGSDRKGRGYLILGIGINVREVHFPPELQGDATSLRLAGVANPDRPLLIAGILGRLEELYRDFAVSQDLSPILELYRKRSVTLGRRVQATGPGREFSGLACGLTEEGGLRIRMDNGEETELTSGEISLRETEKSDLPGVGRKFS